MLLSLLEITFCTFAQKKERGQVPGNAASFCGACSGFLKCCAKGRQTTQRWRTSLVSSGPESANTRRLHLAAISAKSCDKALPRVNGVQRTRSKQLGRGRHPSHPPAGPQIGSTSIEIGGETSGLTRSESASASRETGGGTSCEWGSKRGDRARRGGPSCGREQFA